jgi:hypothetical protein
LHAGFAADAALMIEVDDAVRAAKQSHRRANLDARGIVAVVAAKDGEVAARIRVTALLDILDPGAIHSKGDIVFFFAGDRASMTADAAVLIDEKSLAHEGL